MSRKVKAGEAYVRLSTQDKFSRGLSKAQAKLRSFASGVGDIGRRLAVGGAALATPIAAAVGIFSSFDDAMRGVKAITGASGEEFESLRAKAEQLGASTSFSASQVASLMTELGRAGFDPAQIEGMTGAVMNLARATGTDATVASGIFAASIRQFGLGAGDASRVADGLTAAANKSFNSVESLGEALKYAGPVAADANMSLEETLAILGTLGNVGIQGSSAGNALKRLLTLSAAESKKFQDVFGVATADAAGNARPLVDVLGEVAAATENLGSSDRAAKFNEVFGMLGITSASAIGKSVTDTRALLGELESAGGIAAATAEEMDSGIGGSFRVLLSSVEGLAIAIGDALAPTIQRVAEFITDATAGVSAWIKQNKSAVVAAGAVVAGVTALGVALSALAIAAGAAAAVLAAIGSAVTFLVSPVGLVVAGLTAAGVAGGVMAAKLGILQPIAEGIGSTFRQMAGTMREAFGGMMDAMKNGRMDLAAEILFKAVEVAFLQGIARLLDALINMDETAGKIFAGMATRLVKGFANLRRQLPKLIGAAVMGSDVESSIGGLFSNGLSNIGVSVANRLGEASQELDRLNERAALIAASAETEARMKAEEAAKQDAAAPSPPNTTPPPTAPQPPEVDPERERLKSEADALRDSLRTPIELFRDEIRKLRRMARDGLIDPEIFARGVAAAREKLASARGQTSDQLDRITSTGTFSGFVAARFSPDGRIQSRIADATERTADGIDRLQNARNPARRIRFS